VDTAPSCSPKKNFTFLDTRICKSSGEFVDRLSGVNNLFVINVSNWVYGN